ncbi:formimidoylglutamate deiminase [Acidobacteria bacterium AB60]|nr:formimidoylglutamate deiminase [Acidobacteria bacterium AB60]
MSRLFLPDLMFAQGRAHEGAGLLVDDAGVVAGVVRPESAQGAPVHRLAGRALLPGLANAHSHTFQRLFRARAEGRARGGDTFWTWREQMYRAAAFVSPEDVYEVARAAFLEMLSSGITAVGEFHYVHNDRDGRPYSDANTMAKAVVGAAESVGMRICLLRSAYLRAGFQKEPHPGQQRFYETGDAYLRNHEALITEMAGKPLVKVGAAPHSVRAVPLPVMAEIAEVARRQGLPLHLHISEQPAENDACVTEYGTTPVTAIAERGVLSPRTTLVHAIHLSQAEFARVAQSGSTICSCPTTERNLGDGVFPADVAAQLGIPVALGTDSQAQIDLLEDARENEYHLRLVRRERGILDGVRGEEIAGRLLDSASKAGYRSLGLPGGGLANGEPADFFTLDLDDVALLGTDAATLASQVVFAGSRAAIRDVAVAGRLVMQEGRHLLDDEIRARFRRVVRRFVEEA